jgi:hypothetical protein
MSLHAPLVVMLNLRHAESAKRFLSALLLRGRDMNVATLNLNLGSAKRSFLYRKGTRDEAVIVQALKNNSYNLGRLRRGKALSDFYERAIQAGKVPLIIDANANIGAATLYFACSFAKAQVVAVEAEQSNFDLLSANTKGLPVECLHSPSVSINEIIERHAQAGPPFIVKLHSEDALFPGNTEWVARTPVIIVELIDGLIPGTAKLRKFVECIADSDRDFVYLHDSIFSINRELIVS